METPICGKKSKKKSGMNSFFSRKAGVNDGIKERRQEPPWGLIICSLKQFGGWSFEPVVMFGLVANVQVCTDLGSFAMKIFGFRHWGGS